MRNHVLKGGFSSNYTHTVLSYHCHRSVSKTKSPKHVRWLLLFTPNAVKLLLLVTGTYLLSLHLADFLLWRSLPLTEHTTLKSFCDHNMTTRTRLSRQFPPLWSLRRQAKGYVRKETFDVFQSPFFFFFFLVLTVKTINATRTRSELGPATWIQIIQLLPVPEWMLQIPNSETVYLSRLWVAETTYYQPCTFLCRLLATKWGTPTRNHRCLEWSEVSYGCEIGHKWCYLPFREPVWPSGKALGW